MTRGSELRFAGFSEEWEEKKLSEISILNPKSDSLPEIFNYVDLSSVNGTKLIESRKINKIDAPSRAQRYAKKGDIFYQTVRPYQRNNYFFDLNDDDYVFSTGYAQIRARYNAYYLFSQMQTNKFVDSILNRCTGTSFPAISTSDLSDMKLLISTSEEEQEKIGDLFSKIDQLIESQQELVDQTMAFKKSMLQKMFPKKDSLVPEFRFDGFSGSWQTVKVKDIFKITRGNVLSRERTSEEKTEIFSYPVYSSQTTSNGLMGYYNDYLFDTAITWTTDGANAGDVNFRNGKFYATNVCGVLLSEKKHSNKAVAEILNSIAYKHVSKVGNPKLMNNVMSEIIIRIPNSIEEEIKISNFLENIDEKIAREEKLLDAYKDMKKSLLQKIFV